METNRPIVTGEAENLTPETIEAKRPRRRRTMLLTLALAGTLGGFLSSYLFQPRYTSTATIVVEVQKVPDTYVQSVITADFTQRVQTIFERIMSPVQLRAVVKNLALVKPEDEGKRVEYIQQPGNVTVDPVITSLAASAGTNKEPSASSGPQPGLNVSYTDSNAQRAQKICSALAEQFVNENLKSRGELATSVVEFLHRQVEEAKHALDEQDAKLAAFKKQHIGKIPTDGRTAMNPDIEVQYKLFTRDIDDSLAVYKDLLAKESSASLSVSMETAQLGEQMRVLIPASLPDAPEFPNRPMCALSGLGAGLLVGIGRLLWPAARKLFQRLALLLPSDAEVE